MQKNASPYKNYIVIHSNMETVSVKLESPLVRKIEQSMKEFNYSTKTEFIRSSIREKLIKLDDERTKEIAWQHLFAARDALKGQGKFKTNQEFYNWRNNEGSKELMEYYEKKFDLKEK